MKKRILQGIFWIVIYLLVTLGPLIILLIGPRPAGREFWRDLSVALGYCGFSMIGLQFILTARFKVIKAPYGSDIVYYFHRQISLVAFALIITHPLLLFVFDPKHLRLLNLFTAPWAARFGIAAFLFLVAVIAFSIWRKRARIEYDRWRIWHGLLAIGIVVMATIHIELRGYYLNSQWKQVFWIIYGILWVSTLLWVRVIKPLYLLRNAFVIEEVIAEPGKTWSIRLRPENNKPFRFQPGQFAWLTAWDSPFVDHEHPFSISSSAEDNSTISFTIKELGDFTARIKDLIKGQRVFVDGPFGAFSIDRHPQAKSYVFIAGGIGITPIMSMIRTLADRADPRPLTLIYANKSLENTVFLEELEALSKKVKLKVIHVLESPSNEWTGETGFVNSQLLEKYLPVGREANQLEIFICGPVPMMNAVEKALSQIGISLGDFHSERFDLV